MPTLATVHAPVQLVPAALLAKSGRILFIAHLALGDFTYLQNFFQAFAQAHPHLQVDVWVDEVRRSRRPARWPQLKKYALYDWLKACPFIARVYDKTYSPALYRRSIARAQQMRYPLVVSLSTLRPPLYAALAREISADGFVAGMQAPTGFFAVRQRLAYRQLDASLDPAARMAPGMHISAVYASWFEALFGLKLDAAARFPFVAIQQHWQTAAHRQLAQWGFAPMEATTRTASVVFINPFAKTQKRCWPLSQVVALIRAMRHEATWTDACFVVNVIPEARADAEKYFAAQRLERVRLFSAEENFFQLPAMLAACDLIISVETAVMHLANAVHVPVVALMRQKNPEWAPIDAANSTVLTTLRRRDWVKAITVAQVMAVLATMRAR